ncbi:hypothetical protein MHYP_G00077900 [Metynnis hypsauchen]
MHFQAETLQPPLPLSEVRSSGQQADSQAVKDGVPSALEPVLGSLQIEQLLRRAGQMKGKEQYRSPSRGRVAGGEHEAELLENENEIGGETEEGVGVGWGWLKQEDGMRGLSLDPFLSLLSISIKLQSMQYSVADENCRSGAAQLRVR